MVSKLKTFSKPKDESIKYMLYIKKFEQNKMVVDNKSYAFSCS